LFLLRPFGASVAVVWFFLLGCSGSTSSVAGTKSLIIPTINWAVPTAIPVGTALSGTQLDAAAVMPGSSTAVPGTFTYNPLVGTVETSVGTATLSATFTPSDTATYTSVVASVPLSVTATPKTPTISWPTPVAVPVGTVLSATQLDATASAPGNTAALAGTFVYTPAAGTVESTSGNQTLAVTFTPTDTIDYTTAKASVTLTVTALLVPTITWSTPAAITAGTALSATQLDATATAPGSSTALAGTFVYAPAAGTVQSTPGTQTLSVTFTPSDTVHYATATATVTVTVNAATPSYTFSNVQIVGGGYITGIVMHPAQQGLMYARTDIGGAYRWNSTAQMWVPLTDFTTRANSGLIGIESIGIDPSDPQRLYLAAGMYTESYGTNGAMLVSDNQGASFTTVALPFKNGSNDNGRGAGERLAVDPNLGSTIFFGSRQNGLWKSTDYGVTWNEVTTFPVTGTTSGVGVVFEDFIKGSSSTGSATNTIYAGVSATGTGTDPASLYVSHDAGVTWTAVPGAPTGLYVSHGAVGADGNLYFTYGDQVGPNGLTTGAVYQYVPPTTGNPTGTWNTITPPRSSGYQGGYGGLALDPELPGAIIVSTLDHYYPGSDDLWRSTNYGKTWYSINAVGAYRDVSLSPWVTFGAAQLNGTINWPTALAIDPFDSNHVVQGSGATILTTDDILTSDTGFPSNWTIGALGIEETAVLGLISPPSGPANLLSVMGDLGGFQHTTLTASPVNGAFSNPLFDDGTGIDFAQSAPTIMARVGTVSSGTQFGAYSTNSGTSWTPFATNPANTVTGAGSIAVSADGTALVWSPSDAGAATSYSTNNGSTWITSTGAPAKLTVLADRVNPKTFYIYDGTHGVLYMSSNGGVTFAAAMNGVPTGGTLNVAYDAEGSLYLVSGSGLYHAIKGASSFSQISGVQSAWGISEGAPQPGSTALTLFLAGEIAGQGGLYRSTNSGGSWIRIDDAANEYGYWNIVQGDPRVFARVYIGTGGRGIVEADSPY